MQFFYEDGQGHDVDEHGVEPMDLVVDEELYAIETISSRTQFLMNKPPERPSNPVILPVADERNYDVDMELYNKRRYTNPSTVVNEVVESLKQNYEDFNVSRSTVYNFMTTQCNLSIKQAQFHPVERNSEEKIQQRYDWVQKWQQTDLDFTTNCVFLDESAFHINLKRGMAWSKKDTPAVVTVPMTKAKATSILGAISATGLIIIETVIGHYLSFLKATLDEMDKDLEMKGHYLVMDNAPIHSSTDIGKYIHTRGYRYACDSLHFSDFKGFFSHSAKCFDKCLNKEKL
ncbi:hypothetical protein G6F60_008730 [Rhizopus arrhizus]|uniref:Tc1-like transposase DDE domain-containing protein n=1 Tax=Rhizopus oryzae TaxID=64495 RepID=A0A9P6X518_RHIOR|nr:hypothetical protein G6F66_008268 [Rhizopus arrhizus]KAG1305209.1 hypothetical protein G6F64_008562 [Rhizopus arrhizus]KAG1375726.1 hypothetical protein G6F61_008218 [Rhizopus arrhizus]KAG1397866.1 hypothetical protein G6F60_008730 [Rhizopus arrhizus]